MALDPVSVDDFAASFGGTLHRPTDASFESARAAAVYNGDIIRRPALIVQPTSPDQVAQALAFARAQGAAVTVRGGGHGFSGRLVADGAVMIDLSRMGSVRVDAQARRAYVGGGAKWADVDAATAPHGLAVVGGMVSHTGVAGLALTGGMGWLSRAQGLTCDNLLAATLVTADGRTVVASAESEPELYWGVRGAGANFGVVTELVFALHEVNPMVNLGLFFWRAQDGREPVRLARELVPALPEGMNGFVIGMSAPPAPFVPEHAQGLTGWAVIVVGWGEAAEHAAAVAPLRAQGPLFELVTPMPYAALQQMIDESAPWGSLNYEKGLYLPELTDEVVDVLVERLAEKVAPLSFMPLVPLHGAYCQVSEDATAFGGRRSRQWAMSAVAVALDQESFQADRSWVRGMYEALRAYAPDDASYLNFNAEPEAARVRAAYGEEKFRRLQALKAQWDPQNVFANNANIPPAGVTLPGPRLAAHGAAEPV